MRASVVSGVDTTPVLEASEHDLDLVAAAIERSVVRDLDLATTVSGTASMTPSELAGIGWHRWQASYIRALWFGRRNLGAMQSAIQRRREKKAGQAAKKAESALTDQIPYVHMMTARTPIGSRAVIGCLQQFGDLACTRRSEANMSDHVDSVKAILRLFTKWKDASIAKGENKQAEIYRERIEHIQNVVDELEKLRRLLRPIPASYGDLSDLPPELVKELSGIKVDDLEQQLFTVIKAGGEEVDLDSILIELFRRFKVVQTRKFLQNKLWRMAQKGVISTVAGKKGIYTAGSGAKPPPAPSGFTSSGLDDLDDDVPF